MVNIGTDCVGIDNALDVQFSGHMVCKKYGITNTENLSHLDRIVNRRVLFFGLPLFIEGGTGSPIRAFAWIPPELEEERADAHETTRYGSSQRLMPKGHWDWTMPVPFSQGWRCGDFIFVGGQIFADATGRTIGAGDIETQTRNVFQSIRAVLNEAGADIDDIVKFNTFYCFEGSGDVIREYWEAMTRVRSSSSKLQALVEPQCGSRDSPIPTS